MVPPSSDIQAQHPTLTVGPIGTQLTTIAVPLLIGSILQQCYNTVDSLMVGWFVGEKAFAAIGVAGAIMNLAIFLICGCCTGISIILANLYGSNNLARFRREVFLAVVSGCALSVLLGGLVYQLLPTILHLVNTPADLVSYATEYLNIILTCLVVTFVYNLGAATLRAAGNTKAALAILAAAIAINTLLDYLFVAIFAWGPAGAAWATVIAQGLSSWLCLAYLNKQYPQLLPTGPDCRYDKALLQQTASYSLVSALHASSLYIGKLLVQGQVNALGTSAIAAFTAASRVENFANSVGPAASEAMSVFIAQNLGAGNKQRAKTAFVCGMKTLPIIGLVMSSIMFVFAKPFLAAFLSAESETALATGTKYLQIVSLFYFLPFIANAYNGWFRGSGQLSVPFYATTTHISIRLLFSWLFCSSLGLAAVAWGTGLGWSILMLVQTTFFIKSLSRFSEPSQVSEKGSTQPNPATQSMSQWHLSPKVDYAARVNFPIAPYPANLSTSRAHRLQ